MVEIAVDGRLSAGPTPQINLLCEGDKKNEARTSPTPKAGVPPSNQRRLADEWYDDARDQVPVAVDRERHHGLHVENEARLILGPDVLLPIELKRQAHQRRNRVRELLGKFLFVRARRRR